MALLPLPALPLLRRARRRVRLLRSTPTPAARRGRHRVGHVQPAPAAVAPTRVQPSPCPMPRQAAPVAPARRDDGAGPAYGDAYRAKIELVRAAGHRTMTSAWTPRDDAEAVALRLADEVYRTGLTLTAALDNPASTIGYVNELRVRLARAQRGLVHAARYAAGLPPLPAAAPHVPAPRDGSCVLGCALL